MVNAKTNAVAKLTLRFQMAPNKYVRMSFNHVNPDVDLTPTGKAIASVTQYRGYPYELSTSFG